MHVTEDNNLACTVVGAVPVEMTMIPAKLKSKGYTSHHIGKWHLGQTKTTSLPINRGFDTDFSYLGGAEDHYTNENGGCGKCGKHVDLWRDHAPARGENGTGYTAFAWNNEAVKIIRGHEGDSNPWFMYLALQCAHAPNEPDVFAGLYSSDQHSEDYIDYNGMISAVDSTVGNVTSALKATNQWKNTLLVFTSDNGGPSGGSVSGASANNWPLRGGKHTAWEGGHRVLAFVTGGLVPAAMRGKKLEGYVHAADWCKQAPSNPPCAPACQANEPENRVMQM
jgi:arylsulfatase B